MLQCSHLPNHINTIRQGSISSLIFQKIPQINVPFRLIIRQIQIPIVSSLYFFTLPEEENHKQYVQLWQRCQETGSSLNKYTILKSTP